MTLQEAIDARHSVRAYIDMPISEGIRNDLNAFVAHCNRESGLNISIKYDDPDGFDSRLAHYGRFRNVKNYIVLAGKNAENFDFICGYYGEKIVLYPMLQFQFHVFPQPYFLVSTEILDLIPPVAVPDYCRNRHGYDFIQITSHLRLLPCVRYSAETFFHHTDHLGVLFAFPFLKSFW